MFGKKFIAPRNPPRPYSLTTGPTPTDKWRNALVLALRVMPENESQITLALLGQPT
jgi:hypothetical protein